jgi:two-component sensor histidine kinase
VLTRESWAGAPLAEVADETLRAFRGGVGQRFLVTGPDLWLPPRLTLAFTMALHELATNAAKYGALSNDAGRILLNWEIVGGAPPTRFVLRWEEVGGPPVTEPARRGFGTRLIERALAVEAGGTAAIAFRRRGVVFTLEAPLPDQVPAAAEAAGA